jgi:hypothetical protein
MCLIILFLYGMTQTYINILPFIFDELCSTLYLSSTLVAPRGWLQFVVETCGTIKNNCAILNKLVCVRQHHGICTVLNVLRGTRFRKNLASSTFNVLGNSCLNLRLPPRCKLDMRSSGIFRSVEW